MDRSGNFGHLLMMMRRFHQEEGQTTGEAFGVVFACFIALVLVIVLIIGCVWGVKGFSRWQARSDRQQGREQTLLDAKNRVRVSSIEIQNQGQRIKVAKQRAQIRFENAVGVREAQDEIRQTLSPLYVQFEMVEALKAIAKSGKNSSVIYLPSGANGIPLVSTVDPDKVTAPTP